MSGFCSVAFSSLHLTVDKSIKTVPEGEGNTLHILPAAFLRFTQNRRTNISGSGKIFNASDTLKSHKPPGNS